MENKTNEGYISDNDYDDDSNDDDVGWWSTVGDKYMPGSVGALWSITPLSSRLTSIDMLFLCLHAEPEFVNV